MNLTARQDAVPGKSPLPDRRFRLIQAERQIEHPLQFTGPGRDRLALVLAVGADPEAMFSAASTATFKVSVALVSRDAARIF